MACEHVFERHNPKWSRCVKCRKWQINDTWRYDDSRSCEHKFAVMNERWSQCRSCGKWRKDH